MTWLILTWRSNTWNDYLPDLAKSSAPKAFHSLVDAQVRETGEVLSEKKGRAIKRMRFFQRQDYYSWHVERTVVKNFLSSLCVCLHPYGIVSHKELETERQRVRKINKQNKLLKKHVNSLIHPIPLILLASLWYQTFSRSNTYLFSWDDVGSYPHLGEGTLPKNWPQDVMANLLPLLAVSLRHILHRRCQHLDMNNIVDSI